MSGPVTPGKYKISNGAQGPGGAELFLTFTGQGNALTINPAGNAQVWVIAGTAGLMSITPDGTGFQANATSAGQFVQATTNPLNWNINYDATRQLNTIQTVGAALDWDLAGASAPGVAVALASPTGALSQYWKFAPSP